ncbi:MAG: hypothetical protein ABIP75_19800 [Pyrinomonadaceae bacterium]
MLELPKPSYLPSSGRQSGFLTMTMILIGIGVASLIVILLASGLVSNPIQETYMVPWIGLVLVVILAPIIYLSFKGQFDLFNPIVFAAWSYFLPSFVLGSLFLATHLSWPFFIHLIPDLEYYLPLSLVYVALGFAGLTLGFFLPPGRQFGVYLAKKLPVWDWQPSELLLPGVILLGIGLFLSLISLALGVIGYQQVDAIEEYNGLVYFLSLVGNFASFILWFALFKTKKWNAYYWIVLGLLLIMVPIRVSVAGNRGSLLQLLIGVSMAYWFSGRRVKLQHGLIFGCLMSVALIIGMAYGTTFRNLKGSESRADFFDYFATSQRTIDKMADEGIAKNLETAGYAIGERFDTTSSLAVVVANHENLEGYEEGYHLSNNVVNSLLTAFIPRFIWNDKPMVSDARAYSQLYFDFGENSFAITLMGDLLRNFGPFGVPIGMILLGILLRIFYAALVEGQVVTAWRAGVFFMLMNSISYEGFFDSVLPSIVRFGIVAILSVLVIKFFSGWRVRIV